MTETGKEGRVNLSSTALLDCLVEDVRGLWKTLDENDSTGQFVSNSAYNDGLNDVLMVLYQKQSNVPL